MIKVVVMDVDGSLTDGKLYIGPCGEMMKAFHVKDGMAVVQLQQRGVIPVLLTGRFSEIVESRAKELGISYVFQSVDNKLEHLKKIGVHLNIPLEEFAYFGDDINDLAGMEVCGQAGCPSDAAEEVKEQVNFISNQPGGNGALREFVEFLLEEDRIGDVL